MLHQIQYAVKQGCVRLRNAGFVAALCASVSAGRSF